jgi:hypothetical protein
VTGWLGSFVLIVTAILVVLNRPRANVIVGLQGEKITILRVMYLLLKIVVVGNEYRECGPQCTVLQPSQLSWRNNLLADYGHGRRKSALSLWWNQFRLPQQLFVGKFCDSISRTNIVILEESDVSGRVGTEVRKVNGDTQPAIIQLGAQLPVDVTLNGWSNTNELEPGPVGELEHRSSRIGGFPRGIGALLADASLPQQQQIGYGTRQKQKAGEPSKDFVKSKLISLELALLFLFFTLLSLYFIKTSIDDEAFVNVGRLVLGLLFVAAGQCVGYCSLVTWGFDRRNGGALMTYFSTFLNRLYSGDFLNSGFFSSPGLAFVSMLHAPSTDAIESPKSGTAHAALGYRQ